MKRWISVCSVLVLFLSSLPMVTAAQTAQDYTYEILENGTAQITGYVGEDVDLEIPSALDGIPVTSIGGAAFSNTFGGNAIESVIIPEGVTLIRYSAFQGCSALDSLQLPTTLKEIETYAFSDCVSLTAIGIPEGVEIIRSGAFAGCTALHDVTLPTTLIQVQEWAFQNTAYYHDETNWEQDVLYCGSVLMDTRNGESEEIVIRDGTTLLADGCFSRFHSTTARRVAIPEGVEEIPIDAFYQSSVESVTLPQSLRRIGERAFDGCRSLSSVTFPAQLELIGQSAFSNCVLLGSVDIPGSVTEIGAYAFEGCTALADVVVREGTKRIMDYAFRECMSLTSLSLPDTVEWIGSGVIADTALFGDASRYDSGVLYIGNHLLKTNGDISENYTVKEGVKTIASEAFASSSVKKLTVSDSVVAIGDYAFFDSLIESVALPSGLSYLGAGAFKESALIGVVIPDGITMIGEETFFYCDNLKEVQFSSTVETIGERAFYGSAIETIALPAAVQTIKTSAFEACRSLRTVKAPKALTVVEDNAFANCPLLHTVYYAGDESDWDNIRIGEGNSNFKYCYRYNGLAFAPDGGIITGRGDVNGDGSVTIADAVRVYYHVNGAAFLYTMEEQVKGDVTKAYDELTIADAVTLYYFVNGKITVL